MATDIGETDKVLDAEEQLAEGLRLISGSSFGKESRREFRNGWTRWVHWCIDAGVDPLGATWEQTLECLLSDERMRSVKGALRCVYRARGVASPSDDRRLENALGMARRPSADSYVGSSRLRISLHLSDYLAWCHRRHKNPASVSVEEVAEYLSSLGTRMTYRQVRSVNVSVSLYLMEQGHPPTEAHPLVMAALKQLRGKGSAMKSVPTGGDGKRPDRRGVYFKQQWEEWRDAQGIALGGATVADVLQYLQGYGHQRTAVRRLKSLRKAFGDREPAFCSEEVADWLVEFQARLEGGEVPGHLALHVGRAQPILDEWAAARAARASAEGMVPVGLTREEMERVRVGQRPYLEPRTLAKRAYLWADFSEWRKSRGIPLESVEPAHVRVYLEALAETSAMGTMWHIVRAVSFGFEEHGFLHNPCVSDEVKGYMSDLEIERKEAVAQVDPIRFTDLKAIYESACELRRGERLARADLRGVHTASLLRLMHDGMLRGGEAAGARWGDLSRSEDGTGSLLLTRSKTDRLGLGEYTYVSAFALQHLDMLRDLRRFYGKAVGEGDRIFGAGLDSIRRLIIGGCAAVGLEGRFGTHSLRVGAAQDLAVAGFSLPMIMVAGRWKSPEMPARYIRNLKVLESAMPQLQGMLETDQHRLGPDARGIDVLSRYDIVRFVR